MKSKKKIIIRSDDFNQSKKCFSRKQKTKKKNRIVSELLRILRGKNASSNKVPTAWK